MLLVLLNKMKSYMWQVTAALLKMLEDIMYAYDITWIPVRQLPTTTIYGVP